MMSAAEKRDNYSDAVAGEFDFTQEDFREIATMLRNQGLAVEVYLEEGKMKKKLAYADKLGVPFVVFVGEDEISSGMFAVKNMATRQQTKVSKDQIFAEITKYVG